MVTRARLAEAFGVVLCAALAIAGCVPKPAHDRESVDDTKKPAVVQSFDESADAYIAQYRRNLAQAAKEIAEEAKSGGFSDMIALNDAWVAKTKDARVKAQVVLIDRMNEVRLLEPSDAKVVEMFEKLSNGWSR